MARQARHESGDDRCRAGRQCGWCRADQAFLRANKRPSAALGGTALRMVDLFSGCGGMSVGLWEAARRSGSRVEVALAVDLDEPALSVYRTNFHDAVARRGDVSTMFAGRVGSRPHGFRRTPRQRRWRRRFPRWGPPVPGTFRPQQPHPPRGSEERPVPAYGQSRRGTASGRRGNRERRPGPKGPGRRGDDDLACARVRRLQGGWSGLGPQEDRRAPAPEAIRAPRD